MNHTRNDQCARLEGGGFLVTTNVPQMSWNIFPPGGNVTIMPGTFQTIAIVPAPVGVRFPPGSRLVTFLAPPRNVPVTGMTNVPAPSGNVSSLAGTFHYRQGRERSVIWNVGREGSPGHFRLKSYQESATLKCHGARRPTDRD